MNAPGGSTGLFRQWVRQIFSPSAHRPAMPEAEVRRWYPIYRFRILESTFLGYAVFYLVRNNLSTVAKDMEAVLGYSHDQIGNILAVSSLTYGIGKFVMGVLSDRSNPRAFMAAGLLMTAACNFLFGGAGSYGLHLFLWGLNGLIQGMGWPPCGRSIGHWFSVRERGTVFAFWNVAHNIGGGLAGVVAAQAATRWGWAYAFYFPGVIALAGSVYLLFRLRDTPQSVGLPPIEVYRNDFPPEQSDLSTHERELGTRELFVRYIFQNRALWLVAFANFFVYIARYSMLDWGPTYLREVKQASLLGGGTAILILEFGGIPSTILMGWLSDKLGGRRGMVSLVCMIPVVAAFGGILMNPVGHLWLDYTLLCVVGFFVYPPVMLLGVLGLDLTSKKAVGTAAGFIGLFGYLGRTVQAKGFGWMIDHFGKSLGPEAAWNLVLAIILGSAVLSILLLSFTWKIRPRA